MNSLKEATTDTLDTFAARVEERTIGPCRVLLLKTPVRSVVSWRGSFMSYPDFAEGDELLQVLAVEMLDKGTRHRDRFALADVLENRGAQLDFHSDVLEVAFQGRALREDVPDVLHVLAEQVREPSFDADEFGKAVAQYQAALHRSAESTSSQASSAFSRMLYDPAHPNYTPPTAISLNRLDEVTVEEIRSYHAQHFGGNELVIAFVGDVDWSMVEEALQGGLGDWAEHAAPPRFEEHGHEQALGRVEVRMPDKQNVDVRIGHSIPVRRHHDDFLPLYLGTFILGGNFSARLMTKIRGEMGLTYGIRAGLHGLDKAYDGHWQVGVTLSEENVERGIEAVLAEVRRFVEGGVTDEEVEDKKTTITGTFKVSLAATRGLAQRLHRTIRNGFEVAYLDRYPAEVEAVTTAQVNDAIRRYIHPDDFQVALAGILPVVKE